MEVRVCVEETLRTLFVWLATRRVHAGLKTIRRLWESGECHISPMRVIAKWLSS